MENKWYVDPIQKGIVRFNDDAFSGILAGTKAQQIVTAVNNHDELLKMLQHAVDLMEELKVGAHDVKIYKSVIAKATSNL